MLSQQVSDKQRSIYKHLSLKHLHMAFATLRSLTQELQDWNINEKLGEYESSYNYMVQYMLDGIDDPRREKVYNKLITGIYQLTDTTSEMLLTRDATTLYYGKKRHQRSSNKSIAQALATLDNSINELSLSELMTDNPAIATKRKSVEQQVCNIFDLVWTNYPATAEDYASLQQMLSTGHLPDTIASVVVSALTLNTIHAFDSTKIEIIIDTYLKHNCDEVKIRALCGILMILLRHHERLGLYDRLLDRLNMLVDEPHFVNDMRNILFQFIRCRDTEKIARRMKEELMPKMMKLSPSLYKKIKEDDAINDIESLEYNPEWQEIVEQSGIGDQLKELNELQMEGADVFMSTFSNLKGFPFFNEMANWFIPFMAGHTAIANIFDNNSGSKQFADLLQSSGFLCNSDKYSFCLSLAQVPEAQRQMMSAQFNSQNIELQEQNKAELYRQSRERESISNRYIQDFYRFYKLHPRHSEFYDLFATTIDQLLHIEQLSPIVHDKQSLKLLGEYFFKNEYYADALHTFKLLSNDNFTDSELYQKMGYCNQLMGQYEVALEYYLKADLIKPNHVWTLRHIATCYRNTKRSDKALNYYLRAEQLAPDNLSVNLNIGHCYLEQEQYNEALKYYFKVDFLDTKGTKARRPIAWCSFLAGKFEQASQYYEKILSTRPSSLDYLNAGHTALALKRPKEAVSLYIKSIENDNNNIELFSKNFEQDTHDLVKAGIPATDIPIIYDYVIYTHLQKQS